MSQREETEEEIPLLELPLQYLRETKALRNIGDDLDCLRLSYPRDRAGGLGWFRPSYRLDSDDSSGSFESLKRDRLKEEFLYFKEGPFSFWADFTSTVEVDVGTGDGDPLDSDDSSGSFESLKSDRLKEEFLYFKEGPFSFWMRNGDKPSGSFESLKSGHSKDDFFDFKEGPFSFWHWDKMRPSPTQMCTV